MKILLTGATGFIGSSLYLALHARNHTVIPFTGTVANKKNWNNHFEYEPDVIIHLAAQTSLREAERHPDHDYSVNVFGTLCGLTTFQGTRFMMASTVTVEGVTDYDKPQPEAIDCHPVSVYESNKYAAELLVESCNQTVFRLCNIYGPSVSESKKDRGIVNQFIKVGLKGDTIKVYRSAVDKIRDCLYIDDLLDAFVRYVEQPDFPSGVYNVCTGVGHPIGAIARMCGKMEVVDDPSDLHPIEKRSWIGDYGKLNRACGWMPRVMIEYGIQRTRESFVRKGQDVIQEK